MSATSWRGEPLPRGRHGLDAEVVKQSQRGRMLQAMLELVGERGYAATTVPAVTALARVSRSAFYREFDDKVDCFIALCDELATELLDEVLASASAPGWLEAVDAGLSSYLQWWQQRPSFSRAYFVELPLAGRAAMEQRDRQYAAFRDLFAALAARARHEQPGLPPLPSLVPRVLVVTVTELLGEEVRAGRTARLTDLEGELRHFIVRLLSDDATADSS